ncbi:MAG: O-antigen polymerase, partial [Flavobacteriaceae bacterium]|nr:O-antigen polymerase [Flavobacteriaceae bacterium]
NSAFMHSNFNAYLSDYRLNHSLSWIGLANWIPFFLCFWGIQPYLNSNTKRRRTEIALLAGTLPVIITGIGQSFFNWNGPIETLNGLIVWYQRPIEGITGMTGLFNNPNYTGLWLNLILPFCLAETINLRNNIFKRIITFLFSFSFTLCTILTNSRAAWICLSLGSLVMLGRKGLKLIFTLLISISLIITSTIYPIFGNEMQFFLRSIIPNNIWMEFTDFQISRLDIWNTAFKSIINFPIFGTGGGSFPNIYFYETGLWKGHAHNLPLELFLSYGIPAGIIILIPIIYLFIFSTKTIFFNKLNKTSIFDKAWVISIILFLFSQLVDVQYFDGRFSITFWILLAGAKNIIDEDKLSKNFIKGK